MIDLELMFGNCRSLIEKKPTHPAPSDEAKP